MYRCQRSFVLVVVMSLLMMMTLLSIVSFDYSRLQLKMAQAYLQKNEIHNDLLFQLKKLENKLATNDKLCLVDTEFATTYPSSSVDWWRVNGCMLSAKPFRIYYVNEKILNKFCLDIHRITLVAIANSGKFYLQTAEIQQVNQSKLCGQIAQLNQNGRQGLRWG